RGRRERELHFRFGGPGGQDREPPRLRATDGLPPQGRLPDPGLALDHQYHGTSRNRFDEGLELGQLRLPAHDLRRHDGALLHRGTRANRAGGGGWYAIGYEVEE